MRLCVVGDEVVARTVRFYRDLDTGDRPAREWLTDLGKRDPDKRLAAVAAIERVLKVHGTDVAKPSFLYVNDRNSLRKDGDHRDPYERFARLIQQGVFGSDFEENYARWLKT